MGFSRKKAGSAGKYTYDLVQQYHRHSGQLYDWRLSDEVCASFGTSPLPEVHKYINAMIQAACNELKKKRQCWLMEYIVSHPGESLCAWDVVAMKELAERYPLCNEFYSEVPKGISQIHRWEETVDMYVYILPGSNLYMNLRSFLLRHTDFQLNVNKEYIPNGVIEGCQPSGYSRPMHVEIRADMAQERKPEDKPSVIQESADKKEIQKSQDAEKTTEGRQTPLPDAERICADAQNDAARMRAEAGTEAERIRTDAQNDAARMRAEAGTDAERIRADAQNEAARICAQANAQAAQILEDARVRTQQEQQRLDAEKKDFRSRVLDAISADGSNSAAADSYYAVRDEMRNELLRMQNSSTASLQNAGEQLSDALRGAEKQITELLDSFRNEMFSLNRQCRESLYQVDARPLATFYSNFHQYVTVIAVQSLAQTSDPAVRAVLEQQIAAMTRLLQQLESMLSRLGMVFYRPEPGEPYDDIYQMDKTGTAIPDEPIGRCLAPGIKLGGENETVLLRALIEPEGGVANG